MRKFRLLALILPAIFAVLPSTPRLAANPAQAAPPPAQPAPRGAPVASPLRAGHAHLAPTRSLDARVKAAAANPNAQLFYYGGPVMHTSTTYTIFWLPSGGCGGGGCHYEPDGLSASDINYQSLINRFLGDVGGSSYYNLLTQNPDTGGPPQNQATFGSTFLDSGQPYPRAGTVADPLLDSDLQVEVSRVVGLKGWQTGLGSIFFIFTAYGVTSCFDAAHTQCSADYPGKPGQYCAYHSWFGSQASPTIYANMWADSTLAAGGCTPFFSNQNSQYPNNDAAADSVINTMSHEYFESVNDPEPVDVFAAPLAWNDISGLEIGDKCNYTFGSVGSNHGNIVLNGHTYIVQQEWSNAVFGCALSWSGGGVRPGFTGSTLPRSNNGSSAAVSLPFSINFLGTTYASLFINTNGNVTFGQPLATGMPSSLSAVTTPMIAPFWADVDTTNSAAITYGSGTVSGQPAFGVTWPGAGYANGHADKLNIFQLVLISRPDTGAATNFDIELNYATLQWETGDTGSPGLGFGGTSAYAGYSNGTGAAGTFLQLSGSGTPGSLLDGNASTGLANTATSAAPTGRHVYALRTVLTCTSAGLTITPASQATVGTTLTLNASSSGCSGTPQYRYWQFSSATSTWTILQDYSSATSIQVPTSGYAAGSYTFAVTARSQGSGAEREKDVYVGYTLNPVGAVRCTSVGLTIAPLNSATLGTTLTLTASSTGCSGTPQYRYWQYVAATGVWTILQDYTATTSINVPTAGYTAGQYTFAVTARSQGSSAEREAAAYVGYTLTGSSTGPCASAGLAIVPANLATVGTTLTLNASSTGCGGTPQYRYWQFSGPLNTWTILQDYSASASTQVVTTSDSAGSYTFAVTARSQGSSAEREAAAYTAYTLTGAGACTGAGLTVSPPTQATHGTPLTLTATSTGCTGTPQYRYWQYVAATNAWSMLQDYGTGTSINVPTTGYTAGAYTFAVTVRSQGSSAEREAAAYLGYTLN